MNRITAMRAGGFAIALGVFGLDRAVKALMTGPLDLQRVAAIKLLPFFDLRWTENYGVSYGMFTAQSSETKFALLGLTGFIALGVAVWMMREKVFGEIAALALVLGGALGNIHDRYTRGYVIDYADLHIGHWRPFLIFNLADAAITFGVLILLARSLLSREKPADAADADNDTATETV
ncbi:MAG: signal peptidase II [Novosphingobium sp.]|uniref:signal peptidase II n=1 Tax=Novosphingobium sp. TaxID=1874826 RepID=UPI003016BB28